ncbi:MAG: MBL fold metallo-hydrolase [Bacilli bacterium]|jgi:glyoxylase-like metal-dependent hydrolase (beta-lactamase superfamily II)|nr:MBL fold metallo-hydrolase [Bacilli bacterium]
MDGFKHVRGNTYCLENKTNIGVIKTNNDVILIDSGNDKDAGRKLRMLFEQNDVTLKYILNTHSNADHIGANAYLINHYQCLAYGKDREVCFSKYPDLEGSLLYGGFPIKEMRNKFLMAKPSMMNDIATLKSDINYFDVPGHFLDMIAFITSDDVIFLGDALFSSEIINKYHLFYIFDIKKYLITLDELLKLNDLNKYIFVPSHGIISTDIRAVIKLNKAKIEEICSLIMKIVIDKVGFEEILQKIFNYYHLQLDLNQYLLIGSTIRNYLSYLHDENKIDFILENNRLLYQTI